MDYYQNNSHKHKAELKQAHEEAKTEKKKVEKAIQGTAKVKKEIGRAHV